jgi:hypothetical protein
VGVVPVGPRRVGRELVPVRTHTGVGRAGRDR